MVKLQYVSMYEPLIGLNKLFNCSSNSIPQIFTMHQYYNKFNCIDLIRNYVKIKMAQRVWVVCTGNLWREWHFEMLTMRNAGFDSSEAY